jgi:hypothetical protein
MALRLALCLFLALSSASTSASEAAQSVEIAVLVHDGACSVQRRGPARPAPPIVGLKLGDVVDCSEADQAALYFKGRPTRRVEGERQLRIAADAQPVDILGRVGRFFRTMYTPGPTFVVTLRSQQERGALVAAPPAAGQTPQRLPESRVRVKLRWRGGVAPFTVSLSDGARARVRLADGGRTADFLAEDDFMAARVTVTDATRRVLNFDLRRGPISGCPKSGDEAVWAEPDLRALLRAIALETSGASCHVLEITSLLEEVAMHEGASGFVAADLLARKLSGAPLGRY